jgi:anti-sigma regulatory factor (Ser/Thr protein kinase)
MAERTADLRPTPQAPGEARGIVADLLGEHPCPEETIDVARLLVSELVTNVLRYAPGLIRLRVLILGSALRVEVHDHSAEAPQVLDTPPENLSGRGMALVESLADDWGVTVLLDTEDAEARKVVWFELPA